MPNKIKILAVDDEESLRKAIEITLIASGYEVDTAPNGLEALKKVADNRPDLILLDVMMPVQDGFETMKALKADPATQDLPVIMLTAQSGDEDVFKGWKSGVDFYLQKPFEPATLLRYVERTLEARNVPTATPYELS